MELLNGSNAPEETAAELTLNQEETVENTAVLCEEEKTVSNREPLTKESILARLRELASADDVALTTADDLARIKQQFYAIRNNEIQAAREDFVAAGNDPETFAAGIDQAEEDFKVLMARIKEVKAQIREQQEAQRIANLEKKKAIIAEFDAMSGDTDNINRHHQRAKELQAEFRAIGEVPPQNSTEIWKQYQEAVERFYDQAKINKELYDYDLKKNLGEKQIIIDEAHRLADETDIILAFRRLQELHDKWREIGPVAKEFREDVWNSFKDASAVINSRYQAFFEERKARERENEEAKTALCEAAEAIVPAELTSYAQWDESTKKIIAMQEQWRSLGYASKKANNQLFARFRSACDAFFAAKAEFYKNVKDELAANMEKKVALCERAEQLMNSTDWRATTDELVKLQKEWKQIGAVGRKQSDAIWKRFQAACDHFFEEKKKNSSDTRHTEQSNLKAKRDLVARLRAFDADGLEAAPDEIFAEIKKAQAEWKEIGHVPFREKDKVYEAFREVIDALFARYDLRGQRSRMASFEGNISEIAGDAGKLNRERERLMRAYEQRKAELNTYENNLGFLSSKSQSGNSMVREIERRVQRLKDDIAELSEKIKLIDKQS